VFAVLFVGYAAKIDPCENVGLPKMKTIHQTDLAPRPIGPYSQAVEANGFIFCSGQIPLDPATGTIVEGDIATQTLRVLENLAAVLEVAQSSLESVVKTTVFLVDLNDFPEVNKVFEQVFTKDPPARSVVQVVALPKGVRLEIEAIAVKQ
jgi:2-iminobutanoate/2-iminopropanoate deaminase